MPSNIYCTVVHVFLTGIDTVLVLLEGLSGQWGTDGHGGSRYHLGTHGQLLL